MDGLPPGPPRGAQRRHRHAARARRAVHHRDGLCRPRPRLRGRKSGTIAGYNYSEANKKAEIVWSEASFKDYIQNPMARMPGTKMAFAGIKNETEIANLWAYLKQFKADGAK